MPRRSGSNSDAELLRYFRELTVEYRLRFERIKSRLMLAEVSARTEDTWPQVPSWEVPDALRDTHLTREELQEELPPLFDALRRVREADFALMVSRDIPRRTRESMVVLWGEEEIVQKYIEVSRIFDRDAWDRRSRSVEEEIDGWVDEMLLYGRDPKESPHRVDDRVSEWRHSDFGAGRSRS